MRDAEPVGDAARVVDILPGTAGSAPANRGAVIVELQGDADDLVPLLLEERSHHRGVDTARHGDDHPSSCICSWSSHARVRNSHGRH